VLGFEPDRIETMMETAGFSACRYSALPPASNAKGPALFLLAARRGGFDGNADGH